MTHFKVSCILFALIYFLHIFAKYEKSSSKHYLRFDELNGLINFPIDYIEKVIFSEFYICPIILIFSI